MRGARRIAAWLGGVLLAVTAAACDPPGPPTLAVDGPPLVDGAQVPLRGTGFEPESRLELYQCAAAPVGIVDCDLETKIAVDVGPDGSFVAAPRVFSVLRGWGRAGTDCRVEGRCVLSTIDFDPAKPPVTVPLVFDPHAPLLPSPSLAASSVAGLTDGQTVRLDGTGFVRGGGTRLRGAPPVEISQCAIVEGDEEGDQGFLACAGAPLLRVPVEADGAFATDLPLSAMIVTSYGDVDCRVSDSCFLLATRARSLSGGEDVVARLDLGFDPDALLLPTPAATVSAAPADDLHDFTSVTITGQGFSPATQVDVRVCRADDLTICDDRGRETPTTAIGGSLTTEIGVWPSFVTWFEDHVDCRQAPGCVVAATPRGTDRSVTVALSFGGPDASRGRYLDPVFDDVDADYDVVYREAVDNQGRRVQLEMDIFRPAGDTVTNRPAIVWMHGGFFTGGDKSTMHPDAIASAQRGYVGISLQYRLWSGASTGAARSSAASTPTTTRPPESSGCRHTRLSTASIRTRSWLEGSPPGR